MIATAIFVGIVFSVAIVCATVLQWQKITQRYRAAQDAVDRETLIKAHDARMKIVESQLKSTQVAIKKIAEETVSISKRQKVVIPGNFASGE